MSRRIYIFILYCLFLLIFSGSGLLMSSCESCGKKDAKTEKKPTKKVKKRKSEVVDTCTVDSTGQEVSDSLEIMEEEKTDSVAAQEDSTAVGEMADSAALEEKLTDEQMAVRYFVEVKSLIPDVIEEIRYNTEHNFVGKRIEGYQESVALMTKEGAEALKKAADELREKGYRIKIYDAYRPDAAVQHFRRWVGDLNDQKMKEEFYPDIEKEVLFKQGYISSRSKHCHGSTVDMTICTINGDDVDMGGHFDFFSESSHSDNTETLTEEQKQNRAILRTAMENNGFKIAGTEWWHFSLIDEPYPETSFNFPVKKLENMIPKTKTDNTKNEKTQPKPAKQVEKEKPANKQKKEDKPKVKQEQQKPAKKEKPAEKQKKEGKPKVKQEQQKQQKQAKKETPAKKKRREDSSKKKQKKEEPAKQKKKAA